SLSGVSVNAFTLNAASATLLHQSGVFTAPTINISAGTYSLFGGTLSNSVLQVGPGGTFNARVGSFDHVTVAGSMAVTELLSARGLTVAPGGEIRVSNRLAIGFGSPDVPETIAGNGSIILQG